MKAREPMMKDLRKFPRKIMARVIETCNQFSKIVDYFHTAHHRLIFGKDVGYYMGKLMMLSLPHPLKLQINKHLFKDLCFLEQFNLVLRLHVC